MTPENERFIFTERGMGDIDPGFPTQPHATGELVVGAEAEISEVLDETSSFIKVVRGENQEVISQRITVRKLADGLNFGHGTISKNDRLHHPEDELDHDTLAAVEAGVQKPDILVEISKEDDGEVIDDDGCGDGRGIKQVVRAGKEFLKRSLDRAKVFGGGATMTMAAKVGLGKAKSDSLPHAFDLAIDLLHKRKLNFGAHTDDHAEGDNCGCGAIDKAPQIIANVAEYREQIDGAVKLLAGPNAEQSVIDEVFDNFKSYAAEIGGQPYSGRKVADKIASEDKIVKELKGPHKEIAIVINTVRGMTVNQRYIREITDRKAQVFAVDEWRMRELSEQLYDDPAEQQKAYISMLVYTLATAGTLTKGDLPVHLVTPTA